MKYLAIDIGQSGSRVRSGDGFEYVGGPAYDAELGLTGTVERILRASQAPESDVVVLSSTGLRGLVPDPTAVALVCNGLINASAVAVADDGFAAHVGALGGMDGVVLAVGSGVVAIARQSGRAAHRDGAGPILGDDGGGFWIGRAGLRAALRASERRGPDTNLLIELEKTYGPIRHAVLARTTAETMVWCIDAARTVLQVAADGDTVAVGIRQRAAKQLAATAAAAWCAVGSIDDTPRMSYTGRVMDDVGLRTALADESARLLPHAQWQSPLGNNLDGALTIAAADQVEVPPLLRWWHQ